MISTTSTPGVLSQFAGLYLRARWFVGAGLVLVSGIYVAFEIGSPTTWVLGAAGVVILAHAGAMALMSLRSVLLALVVDITATHIGISYITISVNDEIALALMLVSATVLVALFSDGWIRLALITYSTAYAVASLVVVNGWGLGVADEVIAIIFVVALIAGVIAAIRRRLVELEAVRAQTLGVVSHELRNNLAGVIGATELLMDPEFTLDDEDRSELISLSHQQALDAGDIIEDLLVASRVERGVLEAVPEPVDLIPLTRSVIRRSESVDELSIELAAPDQPVMAMADPLRYRQILRNLLSNAIRYGGPDITVAVEPVGQYVSVTVADNGAGIESASPQNLFRPYYRSDGAQQSGSTGLGLWIGRDLARKMSGDLEYRRRGDGLTIFELKLPAAPSEPSRPELVVSTAS